MSHPSRHLRSACRVVSRALVAIGSAGLLIQAALLLNGCSKRATTSPQEWEKLRVIDVHAHLGTYGAFDLSLETLLANLDRWHVVFALVSHLDASSAQPTLNLGMSEAQRLALDTVRRHPDRLRGLLWGNPSQGSAAELEPFVAETLDGRPEGERAFVGLKLHPDFDRFLADDSKADPFVELCERHDLVVVVHAGPPGTASSPARIYALARRYPGVPFVLYHMGSQGGRNAAIEVVEESLRKGDARLFLGTGQTPADRILEAVRRVGARRVLFGTDSPYFGRLHYEEYAGIVGQLREELAPSDLDLVMGGNAARLFQLPR